MESILYNKDGLTKEDITEEIVRIKVLLLTADEIMVGYSANEYMFIGGHLEPKESLVECLNREVEEETGIKLNLKDASPFLKAEMYRKDYPEIGTNRNNIIYFFAVHLNQEIDSSNTKYTEEEKAGHFATRKIKLANFEEEIIANYEKYPDSKSKSIGIEMINAMRVYNHIKLKRI